MDLHERKVWPQQNGQPQARRKAIKGGASRPVLRRMPLGHATVLHLPCCVVVTQHSNNMGCEVPLGCLFDHSAGTIWSTNFRLAAYLTMLSWNNMEHQLPLGCRFDHALLEHQLVHHETAGQQLALVPHQRQQVPLNLALVRRHGGDASTPHVRVGLAKASGTCVIMAINQALRAESRPWLSVRHGMPQGPLCPFPRHSRHPGPWLSVMHGTYGIPPSIPPSIPPRAPEGRLAKVIAQRLRLAALHRGADLLLHRVVASRAQCRRGQRPSSAGIIHRRGSMRIRAVMRGVIRAKDIRRDRGSLVSFDSSYMPIP